MGWILFVIYMLLLVYFLFFAEWYGRKTSMVEDYKCNLVLFREIHRYLAYRNVIGNWAVFLNLGGNILGFIPMGFIPPVVKIKMRHIWIMVPLGFLFSLSVECMQLFYKVGSFDVDDILLNTLGTLVGYVFFMICDRIRRVIKF